MAVARCDTLTIVVTTYLVGSGEGNMGACAGSVDKGDGGVIEGSRGNRDI